MHYEKEVTSQVLRGQRNGRGTSAQAIAQSIGERCYYADIVSHFEKKRFEFLSRQKVSRQKASIEFSEPEDDSKVRKKKWGSWPRSDVRRSISHFPEARDREIA